MDEQSTIARAPSARTHQPRCPPLPYEIWYMILSSITDSNSLSQLWHSCTRTSRLLRAVVEDVFLNIHLPETAIRFPARFIPIGASTAAVKNFNLDFHGLSDDKSRAVFKDLSRYDRGYAREEEYCRYMVAAFKADMKFYAGVRDPEIRGKDTPPEEWTYFVCVRNLASATELPDLKIEDFEKRELSVNWRLMLNALCGEEAYARRQAASQGPSIEDKRKHMCKLVETGHMLSVEAWESYCEEKRTVKHEWYREARRLRIKHWYEKHENRELTDRYFETRARVRKEDMLVDDENERRLVTALSFRYARKDEESRHEVSSWYRDGLLPGDAIPEDFMKHDPPVSMNG